MSIADCLAIPSPGIGVTGAELEWLAGQAAARQVIVEIGSWLGRSTRALAEATPGVVYAVDDWRGLRERWLREKPFNQSESDEQFHGFSVNLRDFIRRGKVIPVRMDHADAGEISVSPDMVFIDGNHSCAGVKRDIAIWQEKLQAGGLLCGHDFHISEVYRGVLESLPDAKGSVGRMWEWIKP